MDHSPYRAQLMAHDLRHGDEASEATFRFAPEWGQGRATFGGLVVAAALEVSGPLVGGQRRARSAQTLFAGPVTPGVDAQAQARVLRAGRAATSLQVEVAQEGTTRAVVLLGYAEDRASRLRLDPPARPEAPPPEALEALPYLAGVTPTFTQQLEYRWSRGAMPFQGSAEASFAGYCRLRAPTAQVDAGLVAALVDAWPAPLLPMLDAPAPASTVTWSLEWLLDPTTQAADGWWFFESASVAASAGHGRIRSTLWAPSGAAAALSTQQVAIFG